MAELAGPLLAKDVGILADVVGHSPSQLVQVAAATINAMRLIDPEKTDGQ